MGRGGVSLSCPLYFPAHAFLMMGGGKPQYMGSIGKDRTRVPRLVLEVFLLCLVSIIGACRSTHRTVLTFSVAASLQDSITDVEAAYQRDHSVEFRNNFGASGTLAREIEQGAPVDAFISAGTKPMDQLQSEYLLSAGSRVFLH